MKKVKLMKSCKHWFNTAIVICFILLTSNIIVEAARESGIDSTQIAAYDYTLRVPWLPWDCVQGYSNTTFIVDDATIVSGFTAWSSISASSNDGVVTASKTTYVTKGTNYAQTGDISLEGYNSNCRSVHTSRYPARNISISFNLAV